MSNEEIEEKGVLDALVTKYNLDKSICPNYSEHWKNARLSSDMMFDHDGAFLVKRIANKDFGKSNRDLRVWSHDEVKAFYQDFKIGEKYNFASLLEGSNNGGGLREWYFAGRSSRFLSVLESRWDGGYLFTTYNERVDIALKRLSDRAERGIVDAANELKTLIGQRDSLRDEKSLLLENAELSPQLRKVLESVNITASDLIESDDD
tara:strand:+ start:112 stop:729 length:618 start_codon:yes stop_codon:yes gene_type:complete